ncbi:hypothetical protein [Corynebacterium uterequi]|uniref:hypothetical protein n=1 Tax=Corynebacterium uterequi TaxID=1072256 RepID=UPI0011876C80|nr:hypothetical protein [Corynebacterium uterequi]
MFQGERAQTLTKNPKNYMNKKQPLITSRSQAHPTRKNHHNHATTNPHHNKAAKGRQQSPAINHPRTTPHPRQQQGTKVPGTRNHNQQPSPTPPTHNRPVILDSDNKKIQVVDTLLSSHTTRTRNHTTTNKKQQSNHGP